MDLIIKKIWKNSGTGQLFVTIPKDSTLNEGDYVKIIKVEE